MAIRVTAREIETLINVMTNDENENIKKIKSIFKDLKNVDDEMQSLLHIFVDNKYNNEDKCFLAIKSLLSAGLDPNKKDTFNYIFIQTALYAGYSENFIIKIIEESLKYNLNVNHVDSDNDTIMHTVVYSDDYLGGFINIYKILIDNGFDSSIVDHDKRNLVEAMIYQKKYCEDKNLKKQITKEQISEFKDLFVEQIKTNVASSRPNCQLNHQNNSNVSIHTLSQDEITELERFGEILNNHNYLFSPTIGREKELKNLIITLGEEEKCPLIVGESGVGKTAIVEELVYRIKNNNVPSFLKNKIVLSVVPNDIVEGSKYRGDFEKNIKNLMTICEKYDLILFIDEIHDIFGVGSCDKNDNDMAEVLKRELNHPKFKVIGTTTLDEYTKYFKSSALKRRFEIVSVKEPTLEVLKQIISKTIEDYQIKTNLSFKDDQNKDQLINIIIELTKKPHRTVEDILNNPDLSISIIDKAFAIAKYYDSGYIEINHFIESIDYCERLYGFSKEQAIIKLKRLKPIKDSNVRILKPDFNSGKRK